MIKADAQLIGFISKSREYSFVDALADLSGVGALYGIGQDTAHRERLAKMIADGSKKANEAEVLLSSANYSLASRVFYLASVAAIGAGSFLESSRLLNTGLVGAAASAVLFIFKAGLNSAEGRING